MTMGPGSSRKMLLSSSSSSSSSSTTSLAMLLYILVTTVLLFLRGDGGTTNGYFRLVMAAEEETNNEDAASDLMMSDDEDASFSSPVTIDGVVDFEDASYFDDNVTTTSDGLDSAMMDGFGTSVPDANITGINLLSNFSVIDDESESDTNEITVVEPVDCTSFHYDCYSCLRANCFWCSYDSLCFNTSEFVSDETIGDQILFSDKAHSCKSEDNFSEDRCTVKEAHFDDPMYGGQNWIFNMTKVKPVWDRGIYGNGIRVRINDAGIESSHPEFDGRIDYNASCDEESSVLFNPSLIGKNHGNVVASLVGASGNNSHCGVGIAPKVTFSVCPGLPNYLTSKLDQMDISQNSWAIEGCGFGSTNDITRARYLEDVNAIDDDNSTISSMIEALLDNSTCPFRHNPDNYTQYPCNKCEVFQNPKNRTGHKELAHIMGEDCVSAIVKQCDYFYLEDRTACRVYLDLILNNKFPHTNGECQFKTLSVESVDAFARGVKEGRNGKGIIYVFAAGNENRVGDDTNFQGFGANTRFTIPVASVGKTGTHAAYSTPGASVFIAAPGGDVRQSQTTVIAALNNGKCGVDGRDGTSWAAPIVSGVVALMLEANPNLGWRDVQDILAKTAQTVPPDIDPDNNSTQRNGAGLVHSNWYGFGIVNAEAAVNESLIHVNFGPEEMLEGRGSEELRLYDYQEPDPNTTMVNVTIESLEPFATESVYLSLRLNHTSRGHLRIGLTSPSGTLSVLSPGFRPEDQWDPEEWMKFTTVRNWGEDPNGNWTIALYDTLQGDVNECYEKSNWNWRLYDNFSINNTIIDQRIQCEFNPDAPYKYPLSSYNFCSEGRIDRTNNTKYGKLCDDGVDQACKLLDDFENDTYGENELKVSDSCCACGGGALPSLYPDYLFEWKLEVYGHHESNTTTQAEPAVDTSANEDDADVTEPPVVVADAGADDSSSGNTFLQNKLPRLIFVAEVTAAIIFASYY